MLVIAPHTDDGEFGAGGTLARMVREGHHVSYAALSACEESVPDGWPQDILKNEVRAATAVVGIAEEDLYIFDFRVRHFESVRQDVLQALIDLKRNLRPDLVLVPSVEDLHQDHQTVAVESLRAFKDTTMLAYELPWNNMHFRTDAFVSLSPEDVDRKLESIGKYLSQAERPYADRDFTRAQLIVRGRQIGTDYAEAFAVQRLMFR